MKFIWINILAILIVLTSIVIEQSSFQATSEQISSIDHFTFWQTDSLRNQEFSHSEKTIHIAQDFIPIVVIADFQEPITDFHHYIPLYSLNRQKDYFLLI